MLTMPFQQVDYTVLNRIAGEITGQQVQGRGLAGKLLEAARKEYAQEFHSDPEPISDRTLATLYALHARPEVEKMNLRGLGHKTYELLYKYLVERQVIEPIIEESRSS